MGLGGCVESRTSIPNYILRFYQFGVGIAGILAVGMIVVGAITISLSGAIDKQKEGKDMIKNAIWGVVLLLGSYLILNTVNPELTKLKEPSVPQLEPCVYDENGRATNEPCIPKPYQFETLAGETGPPPLSTNPDVAEFCEKYAPGNSACLRGDCHITLGYRLGCNGYVELPGSQFPLKGGICKWAGQTIPSPCVVRQQTFGALMLFNNRAQNNFRYEITEAYPPTSSHSPNGGHYNGCSVDIAIRKPNGDRYNTSNPEELDELCAAVETASRAAEESGFTPYNEYGGCNGTPSEQSTGGHLHLRTEACP